MTKNAHTSFNQTHFHITQSNDLGRLATCFVNDYHLTQKLSKNSSKQDGGDHFFYPFTVIVPAKVLEDWLKKVVARQLGVVTRFDGQFWGQYQWALIKAVLEEEARHLEQIGREHEILQVPKEATLSQSVLSWRLFSYFSQHDNGQSLYQSILDDTQHKAHFLLMMIAKEDKKAQIARYGDSPHAPKVYSVDNQALWQLCQSLARVYVSYLTERQDWLSLWSKGDAVDVLALIAKKDAFLRAHSPKDDVDVGTPEWLVSHYTVLERTLGFLWFTLFAGAYQKRQTLEARFWQCLEPSHPNYKKHRACLPTTLYLFTVQQLPQIQLDFLLRLSQHCNIKLYHFNPSAEYWSDIVDDNWLQTELLTNPINAYLKESGHPLLSRLGKASRETLSMFMPLSGNEAHEHHFGVQHIKWDDAFETYQAPTILNTLKQGMLSLDQGVFTIHTNTETSENPSTAPSFIYDDSLAFHSCHSLKRQLEVARSLIGRWLNESSPQEEKRQLSDIAIMLPDVEAHHTLISSVFGDFVGLDGLRLPAKVVGVLDKESADLWRAILGLFQLQLGRFYYREFCEWLMLAPLHSLFGLDYDSANRACTLLAQAGFVRGFDEQHLKETLHKDDQDYRRTLAYAIDRLSLSLLIDGASDRGEEGLLTDTLYGALHPEKTLTLSHIRLEDRPIIEALCRVFLLLKNHRFHPDESRTAQAWLLMIRNMLDAHFFIHKGSQALNAVFAAINAMLTTIHSNDIPKTALQLPLSFILETLKTNLNNQHVSSEPSGVITIARFGALRSIPFKLVVMMDLNLATFPRTDKPDRLNLAKAGLRRRGDRVSENDDKGAFLEALYQAKNACWIFYTGQSNDNTKLLPASPVSELLNFLKTSQWQLPSTLTNTPETIEALLLTEHSALPFLEDSFEYDALLLASPWHYEIERVKRTRLPPAPLWQSVYQRLKAPKSAKKALTELPKGKDINHFLSIITNNGADSLDTLSNPDFLGVTKKLQTILKDTPTIDIKSIIFALKNPAKAYLNKLHVYEHDTQKEENEPLSLDGLKNYQLLSHLLKDKLQKKQMTVNNFRYGDLLPAGILRDIVVDEKNAELSNLLQALISHSQSISAHINHQHLQAINQTCAQSFSMTLQIPVVENYQNKSPKKNANNTNNTFISEPINITIYADITEASDYWLNIRLSKISYANYIESYLYHLCWQCIRTGDEQQKGGISIWQFKAHDAINHSGCIAFLPMDKETAKRKLEKWLLLSTIMQISPIALTPSNAMCYLMNKKENGNDFCGDRQAFSTWITLPNGYISNESSHHPLWQKLLGEKDAYDELKVVLPLSIVYESLIDDLIEISAS